MKYIILILFLLSSCSLGKNENIFVGTGQVTNSTGQVVKVTNSVILDVLNNKKITKKEVIDIIDSYKYDNETISFLQNKANLGRKYNIYKTLTDCESFINSYKGINKIDSKLFDFAKEHNGIVDRDYIENFTGSPYNYELYLSYLYLLGKINKEDYISKIESILNSYNYKNIFINRLEDDYDDQFMFIQLLKDASLGKIENINNINKYCKGIFLESIN